MLPIFRCISPSCWKRPKRRATSISRHVRLRASASVTSSTVTVGCAAQNFASKGEDPCPEPFGRGHAHRSGQSSAAADCDPLRRQCCVLHPLGIIESAVRCRRAEGRTEGGRTGSHRACFRTVRGAGSLSVAWCPAFVRHPRGFFASQVQEVAQVFPFDRSQVCRLLRHGRSCVAAGVSRSRATAETQSDRR